jgi:3-hydroxyacyl-[acyl-carrier-protein] dehydratase
MDTSFSQLYRSIRSHCLKTTVESLEADSLEATAIFEFPESFCGFAGHFPGNGVLPGIVQLASVRLLTECVLSQAVLPVSYSRTKFRGLILPNERVKVKIELQKNESNWFGKFSLHKQEQTIVTTGQCEFAPVIKGKK